MTEYRIEYSIQRGDGNGDFTEIGFGSSGTWPTVGRAAYMLESDVDHRAWETGPGMPDPDSVEKEPDNA